MDKLNGELQRLHFLPERLPDDQRQALVVTFQRATDWESAALLWHAVQDELDLPAPAVSIDGQGYRLWFSLAEPVAAQAAEHFLVGLKTRYLSDLPGSRVHFGLSGDLPPCPLIEAERWAAFIDPGMGSMFITEPWLEMAPNRNQQADLLAAFSSMRSGEFCRALAMLSDNRPAAEDASQVTASASCLSVSGSFANPKQFLLAVMNDPQASPNLRIAAATALLPYFEKAQ